MYHVMFAMFAETVIVQLTMLYTNWPLCKNGSSNDVIYIGQVFASMQLMETATNSGGISWPCSRFLPVVVPIPTLLEFTSNFTLLPGATGKGCLE